MGESILFKPSATIRINNLKLNSVIGCHHWERNERQPVIINIAFDYDVRRAVMTDNINDAVNYEMITQAVKDLVESSKFHLVETMGQAIVDLVLQNPVITRTTVRIDKPKAIVNADSVSFELTKTRG
jgi:FolB domain-containing protein